MHHRTWECQLDARFSSLPMQSIVAPLSMRGFLRALETAVGCHEAKGGAKG